MPSCLFMGFLQFSVLLSYGCVHSGVFRISVAFVVWMCAVRSVWDFCNFLLLLLYGCVHSGVFAFVVWMCALRSVWSPQERVIRGFDFSSSNEIVSCGSSHEPLQFYWFQSVLKKLLHEHGVQHSTVQADYANKLPGCRPNPLSQLPCMSAA